MAFRSKEERALRRLVVSAVNSKAHSGSATDSGFKSVIH